ncbi:hypothetical protein, partial [Terrisporobacter muris]|uniref:hypothetical protein n=1 Tax=Terrisporobacter muris TaxID=2963284 RepID=UPI00214AB751
ILFSCFILLYNVIFHYIFYKLKSIHYFANPLILNLIFLADNNTFVNITDNIAAAKIDILAIIREISVAPIRAKPGIHL